MNVIKNQKELIEGDWDNLIILDACRYDVFTDVYGEFFDEDLRKVKSRGSTTLEWLKKTFPEYYNINYVSANPYVNSQGIRFKGFKPTDHFADIVDAWFDDSVWNDDKGTVLPEDMVKYSLKRMDTKNIFHFIQPHRPFLVNDDSHIWHSKEEAGNEGRIENLKTGGGIVRKARSFLGQKVTNLISQERLKGLSTFLFGARESDPYRELSKKWGSRKVVKSYEESLRMTLSSVFDFVGSLQGRTIISSDHGEAFGENGIWGHGWHIDIPTIREVPWLEVD